MKRLNGYKCLADYHREKGGWNDEENNCFYARRMLALGSATVDAAQFSDGAGSYSENCFDGGLRYIWPAGVSETAVEMNKNTDVDVNESVITGLEKPLLFYPEIYYDFKVTGAGLRTPVLFLAI